MIQLGDNKIVKKVVVKEPVKFEASANNILKCKSCGEQSDYSAQYGRYGYFIKCNKCETNTAMKMPCVSCGSKDTKISKKEETYSLNCLNCNLNQRIIG